MSEGFSNMSESPREAVTSFELSAFACEFVPSFPSTVRKAPMKVSKGRDPLREEAKAELKRLKQSRYEAGERGQIHLSDVVLSQLAGYSKPDPYALDRQQRHIVKPTSGKSKVVKTRIVIDNEVVTARMEAGTSDVTKAPKKPTKLKQRILEERKTNLRTDVYIREYVTHEITSQVKSLAISLLSSLRVFYDRLKDNQIKAKTHKRYKQGFRETLKAIDRGKAKCVLLAHDIEDVSGEGGLNSLVSSVISAAQTANLPVMFPLSKKEMGTVLKNAAVSLAVVTILNYEGADEAYKALLALTWGRVAA